MERRNSFRLPVAGDDPQCTLRTPKGSYSGTLKEESAGGYALILQALRGLSIDDIGVLKTTRGTFQVRVAHVTKVSQGVRIGFERQTELSTPQQQNVSAGRNGRKFKNPLSKGIIVPAIISLVVVLGLGEFLFRSGKKNGMHTTAVSLDRVEAVKRFQALRQITGPASTKQMRLSRGQQKRVINVTHKALGELRILSNSRGRVADDKLADLSMQVIYHATEEIHDLLNRRQKEVWSQMVHQPSRATRSSD